MAAFSNYLEDLIINHFLRNQSYSVPPNVYVALFTSNSGLESNSPSSEVSGGSYARQVLTLNAPSNGVAASASDITFPTATANWGTITSVAIVDHGTNTAWGTNVNVLLWADLQAAKTVSSGEVFKILAGDLTVTLD